MLVCIGDIAHVSGGEACTVRLRGDVLQPLTDTRHLCELLVFGFLRCAKEEIVQQGCIRQMPKMPRKALRSSLYLIPTPEAKAKEKSKIQKSAHKIQ